MSAETKHGFASPDQGSETSAEPHSDGSSHEYAASTDGQATALTSFVTADAEPESTNVESEITFASAPNQEVQVQAIQTWDTPEYPSQPNTLQIHAQPRRAKQGASLEMKVFDIGSQGLSRSLAMIQPSWKVSDVFSSR